MHLLSCLLLASSLALSLQSYHVEVPLTTSAPIISEIVNEDHSISSVPKFFDHLNQFKTCELYGLTHLKSFEAPVEVCLQSGARVLFSNQWIRVTLHSMFNETTFYNSAIDYRNTKIFIEFFGDLPSVPIALASSDLLSCDCSMECALEKKIREIGIDGAIRVFYKRDPIEGNVIYMQYTRAQITLYIRKVYNGLNFGIRLPESLVASSQGMCQSGCMSRFDFSSNSCFDMSKGKIICEAAFTGLPVSDISADHFLACSHDVFLWKDVRASISHRSSILDHEAIRKFDLIESLYLHSNPIDFSPLSTYQPLLDNSHCVESLFRISAEQITQQRKIIVEMPSVSEQVVHTSYQSGSQIQREQDTSIEASVIKTEEHGDLSHLCEEKRKGPGSLYLAFPENRLFFIQCDESNRAFLKQCPTGTQFSEQYFACERIPDEVLVQPTVQPEFVQFEEQKKMSGYGGLAQDEIKGEVITAVEILDVKETPELSRECEMRRANSTGIFFIPLGTNRHEYIQCDSINRGFLRACPIGLIFTDKLACERLGSEQETKAIKVEQISLDIPVTQLESVEAKEFNVLCESQRLNKQGLFYLAFPKNRSMFIQCDAADRAFLKTCPVGTVFTDRTTCEKESELMITESSQITVTESPKVTVTEMPAPIKTPTQPVVVIPSYGSVPVVQTTTPDRKSVV